MAEKLYPIRQRCKSCGKGFPERGAILGLYDTYKCAGMAEPFKSVKDGPKWCVTDRSGTVQWKKRMRHEGEVPKALKTDPSASFYWCSHCGFGHIGHSRVDLKVESTRQFKTAAECGQALKAFREKKGWDLKTAAAKANIRPIRLREIEEADPKVTMDNVLKVVNAYHVGISLVFK